MKIVNIKIDELDNNDISYTDDMIQPPYLSHINNNEMEYCDKQTEERINLLISQLTMNIDSLNIDSSDSLNMSADLLKMIKEAEKLVDEKRKESIAPYKKNLKIIEDYYKTLLDPLANFNKIIREKVNQYHQLERQRLEEIRVQREKERQEKIRIEREREIELRRELAEKIAKESNTKMLVPIIEEIPANKTVEMEVLADETKNIKGQGQYANMSFRVKKVFKITDESKLPRELLMPDLRKIQKYVDNDVDINFIANGKCVEVFEESIAIVR